jgi:nitronate monooxygenase
MAGGPTTPQLVAEVSGAGGFGVLSGGYQAPESFREQIREVRRRTRAPFGVNLLVAEPFTVDEAGVQAALGLLRPYADELGVTLEVPTSVGDDVDALFQVVLDERVPFFSFTFGIPDGERLGALREAGVTTCGTATSVEEARAVVDAGADMVCVQGGEAGGHRGGFLADAAESPVGLLALLPRVRDAVEVPVVAAGGIMDGRGVAGVLALGADAAQLGTAFLLCPEAGTSEPYRRAVREATGSDTVITRAFSGKPARGLANRMTRELAGAELPPYPVMNALTRPLRRAAAAAGRPELLSLWAGQGVPLARELPAAEIVRALEQETDAALERLCLCDDL